MNARRRHSACQTALLLALLAHPTDRTRAEVNSSSDLPDTNVSVSARGDPYGLDNSLPSNRRQSLRELRSPWPDVLHTLVQGVDQPTFVPPASPWHDAEKRLFKALLTSGSYDALVVPFQVQHYGIDRIGRSLMTANLAGVLARRGLTVVDPYLAARAFGDGLRSIPLADALRLAEAVHARTVIVSHVGHDRNGLLRLTVRCLERAGDSGAFSAADSRQRDWIDLVLKPGETPEEVIRRVMPEVLAWVDIGTSRSDETIASSSAFVVPDDPWDVVEAGAKDPVSAAAALELLGMLLPDEAARARQRVYERALLAVHASQASTSFARLLQARALLRLERRPAALQALADDEDAAAQALRAILNGNLPAALRATDQIEDPYLRLMARAEAAELQAIYQGAAMGHPPPEFDELSRRGPMWTELLARRWSSYQTWPSESNAPVKLMLDEIFPLTGFSLESLVSGQLVIARGAGLTTQVELAVVRHVRKLLDERAPAWCCRDPGAHIDSWDYLVFLEGLGEATLLGGVKHLLHRQGLPEQAIRLLDEYANIYEGYPPFDSLRAWAEIEVSQTLPPPEQAATLLAVQRHAISALYWEQGQSQTARAAAIALGVPSREGTPYTDAYVKDIPPRAYWFAIESPGIDGRMHDDGNVLAALEHAVWGLGAAESAAQSNDPAVRTPVLAALRGRFDGNPGLLKLRMPPSIGAEDSRTDESAYREAIAAQPGNWQNYVELGRLLIEHHGDYAEASSVYLSFPGFSAESTVDSVALSNYAKDAGSLLYWRGAVEHARPLYEIAARHDNGSEASMIAAMRLPLLAGDYVTAAKLELDRAMRYDSAYAYGGYLALLHALGFADAAWAGFGQLAGRFDNPQVWIAALVGQRLGGLDMKAFRAWILRDEIRDVMHHSQRPALGYALMWNLTDRVPAPDLGQLLASLEGLPQSRIDVDGVSLLKPHPLSAENFALYRPSRFRAEARAPLAPDTRIPSGLVMFAEAYLALQAREYDEAVRRFDQLAERYAIESPSAEMSFALPYFAYASSKAGDSLELRAFLHSVPTDEQRFDYHLALALFEGLDGKTDSALRHLRFAFNMRPLTDGRPVLTEYQYAEVCEWLLEASGDERYRDLLLDWARKSQRIQPMHAWAYTMEARWARTAKERARVLPMALYLDERSARLRQVALDEIAAAKALGTDDNPFVRATRSMQAGADSGA